MAFIDIQQLTPEWLQMRSASVTASHLWEVMAKPKRIKKAKEGEPPEPVKEMACRLTYKKKKLWEQVTGLNAESFVSPYMDLGMENEELARAAYEHERGVEVLPGGLFVHDEIKRFMASPDGRIGEDGLLEIKYLPGFTTETNHADMLAGAEIPEEYQLQMLGQMSCSGRKWVDFVAYDPRFPKPLRMVIRRFERDDARIYQVEQEVCQFLLEVIDMIKAIQP